jgi:hypothetical protein
MVEKKSRTALVEFLEYLAQKGIMAPATAQARKAAVNVVLGILDDQEAVDVSVLDLDDVMGRFNRLHGKEYTPESLRTYLGRVRSAIGDFNRYIENPLAFKPALQARERTPTAQKSTVKAMPLADTASTDISRTPAISGGPMADSIMPIRIRTDLTVYIQGLPFDLTEAEAKKISSVVQAMASPV